MSLPIQHLYQHIALTDRRLYEALDALARNTTASSTSIGTSGAHSLDMTSNPYNVPIFPVVNNNLLFLIFVQDATGNRLPAYPAIYKDGPTGFWGAPTTRTVVGFIGAGGFWQWAGIFFTGLP